MPSLPPLNPYIAGKTLDGERGFFGREGILHEVERTLRPILSSGCTTKRYKATYSPASNGRRCVSGAAKYRKV